MRSLYTTTLIAILSTEAVFAFPDKYEADNSAEEAREVIVDALHREGEQHTLHEKDEDWFKFYAPKDADYDIEIKGVGSDIQIGLELYAVDQVDEPFDGKGSSKKGSDISSRFQSGTAGYYYLRVVDVAEPSKNCRVNMQYTLSMTDRSAGTLPLFIEGRIQDVFSKRDLDAAIISVNCQPETTFCCPEGNCDELDEMNRERVQCKESRSNNEGFYTISTPDDCGTMEVSVWREGYRPITCRPSDPILIREEYLLSHEDMPLFPEDEKMFNPVPTQTNGKLQLEVNFPQGCVDYYVGMLQPDGAFFILPNTNRNDRQPFSEGSLKFLSWRDTGNTALDFPIADLPRGEYQFYFLRTARGSDPMEHLNKNPDDLGSTVLQLK